MENELKIGEYNRLRIIKEVPFGLYLDGYEDEILLPLQYVPETYQIDDILEKINKVINTIKLCNSEDSIENKKKIIDSFKL